MRCATDLLRSGQALPTFIGGFAYGGWHQGLATAQHQSMRVSARQGVRSLFSVGSFGPVITARLGAIFVQ